MIQRMGVLGVTPLHVIDAVTNWDESRLSLLRRKLWCSPGSLVYEVNHALQLKMLRVVAGATVIHWLRGWLDDERVVCAFGEHDAGTSHLAAPVGA